MASQRGVQVASILNNDTALWEGGENGTHRLNMRAFEMIFPSCPFFPLASEDVFVSGGSKTRIDVMIEPLTLVRNLMGVYVHNGDPNKRFMRQSIVDPSGATFVTAPIATRVLIKKTLTQNDEDMVFESFGYALFPDGNTGRTILTVASQSNVGDPNLIQDDVQGNAGLMNKAAAAVNAAITEITNHFPA